MGQDRSLAADACRVNRTLVIGAGLAGLTAALRLSQAGHDVRVLEARDRVGGRAFSISAGNAGVDLGPAWIWPDAQPQVMSLIGELGLETLPQFEAGTFVYESSGGVQRGSFPRRYGDAARIRGGVGALAERMAASLPVECICQNQQVIAIDWTGALRLTTRDGSVWSAETLIVAVPPPIAAGWSMSPAWPMNKRQAMTRWPTWMAAHAKLVAIYDRPFWREEGLSGSAMSQVGPLVEVADQSDMENGLYALFGFVGWPAAARQDRAAVLEASQAQLVRLFGPDAAHPTAVHLMDWATQPFTATQADTDPPQGHPPYGAPELSKPLNGRVIFASAEVSQHHGGLIEGAIISAHQAAAHILTAN